MINSHPSLSSASALLETAPQSSKPASILRQGVVPAPLPTTVKERIDREAAYEKTKEEGAKWAGVMKRVKEAHHLSFPLQASDRGGVKSSGEMLSGYKPREGMESAVQALLDKANLTEKGVQEKEEDVLQAQELSVEELEERRARLRQQRELMFRSEARAKRVAKIKSKTFRKLARKRAARLGESDAVDELDAQASEEMREKMEMDRAKERATLKHGARTSRWAREGWQGEDKRMAKEEMLDIKQRLARRISGKGDGVSGDEDTESDEEGEDEDEDEEVLKARAFDQLGNVDKAEKGKGESGGGLMDMAFMKKAGERRHRQALEEEDELRRDIEMFGESDDSDAGEEKEDAAKASMMRVGGNEGRMVFSGPTVVSKDPLCISLLADIDSRLSLLTRLKTLLRSQPHASQQSAIDFIQLPPAMPFSSHSMLPPHQSTLGSYHLPHLGRHVSETMWNHLQDQIKRSSRSRKPLLLIQRKMTVGLRSHWTRVRSSASRMKRMAGTQRSERS